MTHFRNSLWLVYVFLFFSITASSDEVCLKTENDELEGDYCGTVMASFGGVPAYCNGDQQTTTESCHGGTQKDFGLEYQCVEYIRRFYENRFGVDTKTYCWQGNAINYYNNTSYNELRGLGVFENGTTLGPPQVNDIIIFQLPSNDPWGHVAIVIDSVADVEEGKTALVKVIEQNFSRSRAIDSLTVSKSNGKYLVTRNPPNNTYKVKGWARLKQGPIQSAKNYTMETEVELTVNGVGVRDKAAGLVVTQIKKARKEK